MASVLLASLMATGMAGCVQDDPVPAGADAIVVITDPGDFSQINNQSAGVGHVHDYWGGQDTLQVVNETQLLSWTITSSTNSVVFQPPAGAVIPLGTQYVDITLSWRDAGVAGSGTPPQPGIWAGPPELWIRTAADGDAEPFAQLVQNGATLRYEVPDNAENDLPHQALSAWEFRFAIHPEEVLVEQRASYSMHVTAVVDVTRGLDIPPYPPHPDAWGDADTLPLIEGRGSNRYQWVATPGGGCQYCSGIGRFFPADPDTFVPFDADHVEVVLQYAWTTPTGLAVLYHGADNRTWKEAPVHSDDGATRVYRIPVGQQGDSPYALQSLWRFAFRNEGGNGVGSASAGEYHVSATVHRVERE